MLFPEVSIGDNPPIVSRLVFTLLADWSRVPSTGAVAATSCCPVSHFSHATSGLQALDDAAVGALASAYFSAVNATLSALDPNDVSALERP